MIDNPERNPNNVRNVFLGLDLGRRGILPFLLRPSPLLPTRTVLHMDNALTAFLGLTLVVPVFYGRSTTFPQFR